jgi:hypothetical protein
MGATPDQMVFHKKNNENYQLLPRKFPDDSVVAEMSTPEGFKKYLGSQDHFLDYVTFFEREIKQIGYQEVLQKYMVGGSEIADDILGRMYHGESTASSSWMNTDRPGYVHSFMYVGQALEFKQLPLLAEGLAQAVSHDDMYYNEFLFHVEREARFKKESRLCLADCAEECRRDPVIRNCSSIDVHRQVENGSWKVEVEMIRDYVCGKAFNETARVCARYRVDPEDDLDRATAELLNGASSLTLRSNDY